MEQARKQRSIATKVSIAIVVVMSVAVGSTLVQRLLLGQTNVAITSAFVFLTGYAVWRQFWPSVKRGNDEPLKKETWEIIGWYTALWTILGWASAGQANAIWLNGATLPVSRATLLLWQLMVWYCWGALTPLVFALRNRFPLGGVNWLCNAGLHVTASVVFAAGHLAFFVWTGQMILPTEMGRVSFREAYRVVAINKSSWPANAPTANKLSR